MGGGLTLDDTMSGGGSSGGVFVREFLSKLLS